MTPEIALVVANQFSLRFEVAQSPNGFAKSSIMPNSADTNSTKINHPARSSFIVSIAAR
jgi:hypothetical protein